MKMHQIDGFERITKTTARKVYDAGGVVHVCPVNLRPGWPWFPENDISREYDGGASFDSVVNSATYYNCINSETGKYLAYYLKH